MSGARSSVPVRFVFHERLSGIWPVRRARTSRLMPLQWRGPYRTQFCLGSTAYLPWAARVAGVRGKMRWFVRAVGYEGTGAQTVHLD